jgi:geranyllinalool synthase
LTSFYYSGIPFVRANTEKLVREMNNHCPRWFAIVFPSMVELAHTVGVHLIFLDGLSTVASELFIKQQQILEK